MSVLNISNLSLRIGGRALLDGADLAVAPGQRVGLVGRNGAGKSTLLRAIAGDITPDGGDIRLSARARLGFVRQEAPAGARSLIDCVLEGDQERLALLAEAEHAPAARQAEIHERLRAIGAESAPARAAAILAGLGFDATAQARKVADFSGGWRMRVALASVLFSAPDLLLLDEPTNHLDLEASIWLESWLARFPGAAIVVSHDRGLLDRAVAAIAHLDRGKLSLTPGGFSEFVRIRTEQALQQNRAAERIAARRAHMQAFVDRFRAKATKARQAQARLKALAKLPELDSVIEPVPVRFAFPEPPSLPPPVMTLDRVDAGYGDTRILRQVSARIDSDDRIALLGANGNGKSTLAKLLAGRLAPMAGELRRANRLCIGYFAQHQAEELVLDETPVAHMARALPKAAPPVLRAQLARFGLDADRADTPVANLSGGEKARLLLALATRDAPQMLILDEPTNHLDIDARDALVQALGDYAGAVILITHDPDLVSMIADRLWLVADGTVRAFDGDIEDYKAYLAEAARPAKPAAGGSRRDERRERAEARERTAPLRKKLREAEQLLEKLNAEQAKLQARREDPGLYEPGRVEELRKLEIRVGALGREIAAAEAAWLDLAGELEAAEAASA